MLNPFIYTTRDRWNRPVRRVDHNAIAMTALASGIGTILLWGFTSGTAVTGGKIVARLAQTAF